MGKFEDLPAEIVYDIFDYFSMSDIFGIFFCLNNHYKNLVLNSRSNIQLDFSNLSKSKFDDCCKYLIEHKQNQINSLSFSNPLIVDDFLNRFSLLGTSCTRTVRYICFELSKFTAYSSSSIDTSTCSYST